MLSDQYIRMMIFLWPVHHSRHQLVIGLVIDKTEREVYVLAASLPRRNVSVATLSCLHVQPSDSRIEIERTKATALFQACICSSSSLAMILQEYPSLRCPYAFKKLLQCRFEKCLFKVTANQTFYFFNIIDFKLIATSLENPSLQCSAPDNSHTSST